MPSSLASGPKARANGLDKPELLEVKQKWDRQGLDVTYLLTQTAREPTLSLAFNYASLLLNNSYFLEGLVRAMSIKQPAVHQLIFSTAKRRRFRSQNTTRA
jgi:hypothetical protein